MIDFKIESKLVNKKYSLQFLPESLSSLRNEDTFFYNGKKLKSSYVVDIIHNLLLRYYFKKENLFNLSSLILKEKYGYLYNYYMSYLVFKNVIYIAKEYKQGRNARIYKLNNSIIEGNISRYKNNDKTLLKKYKKAVSIIDKQDIEVNSILPHIKRKIIGDLFNVEIDYEKAMYFLNNTKQDLDCFNKNKYSIESIRDKHIFYHFDSYGRVHTNFTILKSFVRKNCLLINGNKTHEIDISNSQPLFLSKLIYEEGIGVDKHEFSVFCYLVVNGKFYEFLMDNSDIKTKKECKQIVYKILFGRNSEKNKNNVFSNLFPSIYSFISEYKESYGNYKTLSHKLQNEESNFIFNKVIKNINSINSDISVVTIHDSIIIEDIYKEKVQVIMDDLLYNEFHFIDRDYIF